MFGLGLSEIVVILLVVLVLINPKDLPKIARKLGEWSRKFQEAKNKFDIEINNLENEIKKPFEDTGNNIDSEIKTMADSVTIQQPLPDLRTVMPSRIISSPLKPNMVEENNERGTEKDEIETKVHAGGTNVRSN